MIYKLVKASSYLFDCSNYIHIYNQIHNTLYMIQKIRKRTLQFLFFLTQSSNWKVQKTLSTTLSRTFCLEAWLYLEPLLMPFLQLRLDPSHQIKQIENQRGKPKRMMKANQVQNSYFLPPNLATQAGLHEVILSRCHSFGLSRITGVSLVISNIWPLLYHETKYYACLIVLPEYFSLGLAFTSFLQRKSTYK